MRARLSAAPPFALVLSMAFGACAPHVGPGFLGAKAGGDRAYSSGRYDEAVKAYQEAADKALRARDREEALFLVAATYQRAGAYDRAREAYLRVANATPPGERAPRAAFEIAYLEEAHGDPDRGRALLLDAVHRYPNSGPAHRALGHYLEHLGLPEHGDDPSGTAPAKLGSERTAFLHAELSRLKGTDLEEDLLFATARSRELEGDLTGARDAFETCATRFPYPFGGFFDDALWYESLLDEQLGSPEKAIADLRRMLAVREVSTFGGSYERPRFSAAKMRIATLYRDALHDHASARREFHELYENHRSSTLRDDALFQEALLAHEDGDPSTACAIARSLVAEFSDSKYVPCVGVICPSAEVPHQGATCHAYLLRPKNQDSKDP